MEAYQDTTLGCRGIGPFSESFHLWNDEETKRQRHTALIRLHWLRSHLAVQRQRPRQAILSDNLHRLSFLVDFAYETIPYYRDLYGSAGFEKGGIRSFADFEALPVIEKPDLIEIAASLRDNVHARSEYASRTSGSTGQALTLYNDYERALHWFVHRILMYEDMMGVPLSPDDWMYSYYHEVFLHQGLEGKYRTFTTSPRADPADVAEHIRRLRPKLVSGFGGRLVELAPHLPDAAEIGCVLFTTNSETTGRQERQRISSVTGALALDEYSSEELGIIAWEKEDGRYVVAEDTVHLELVAAPDKSGLTVVGTDLWNLTMPRIRYNQGDYAVWADRAEEATGPRMLDRIEGRRDMVLISPDRGAIAPSVFLDLIDVWLLSSDAAIREFRLVQNGPATVRLLIVADETERAGRAAANFRRAFHEVFGPTASFSLEFLEEIPPLGRKRCCIVRRWGD